ncbi:MAG: hypothetical protein EXS32_16020 [Opitutus sp.]|nr:hypothetical protein [Opitutus sp.]
MEFEAARTHIQSAFARMSAAYGQLVFDEWAVLGLGGQQGVLAYTGPRPDRFRREMPNDAVPLRAEAAAQPSGVGDIVFALEAGGTRYDVFVRLGEATYLVCNHTAKTMAEIRANPGWLQAQGVLFELGEKFRADPLEE